jgi:hypothetical protein
MCIRTQRFRVKSFAKVASFATLIAVVFTVFAAHIFRAGGCPRILRMRDFFDTDRPCKCDLLEIQYSYDACSILEIQYSYDADHA